jgi:hypothetical protein
MIKKILIGIILLLLIGCAAKQPAEAPNVDEVTAVDPVDTDEIIETSPIVEDEPIVVKKTIDSSIQKLLDKSAKISSISFNYHELENGVNNDRDIWIKGDLIKIKKKVKGTYGALEKGEEYDTVYLDKSAKTAIGFCEDNKICDSLVQAIELNYDKESILTPLELAEMVKNAEVISNELLQNRNVVKFSSEEIGVAWIDSFYGIIMKVEQGDNLYRYEEFEVNLVKDSEVVYE